MIQFNFELSIPYDLPEFQSNSIVYYYYFSENAQYGSAGARYIEEENLVVNKQLRKLLISMLNKPGVAEPFAIDGLVLYENFRQFPHRNVEDIRGMKERALKVYISPFLLILFDRNQIIEKNHEFIFNINIIFNSLCLKDQQYKAIFEKVIFYSDYFVKDTANFCNKLI